MVEDERCCGTGTCLINAEGLCWCGQQWDGQVMCRPGSAAPVNNEAVSEELREAASEASKPAPVLPKPA
jgi:hypothetical protein